MGDIKTMTIYKDPKYTAKYGLKVCKVCEKQKPVTEFNKDKKTHDKYRTRCKECLNSNERDRFKRKPAIRTKQKPVFID